MQKLTNEQTAVYTNLYNRFANVPETGDVSLLDCLQIAITKIIQNETVFNDDKHFKNYLLGAVRDRRIDIEKQTADLVSWDNSDVERETSYHVDIERNDFLKTWILKQTKTNKKPLFSDKQKVVFNERYGNERTAAEIGTVLSVSQQAIAKIIKTIDRKLMTLPIRSMVSPRFYCGGSVRTNGKIVRSNIWNDTDITPSKTGYLKRFKRTGNGNDLQKFRFDSSRCLRSHKKHIGDTAVPVYNDKNLSPIVPVSYVPETAGNGIDTGKKKPALVYKRSPRDERLIKRYRNVYLAAVRETDNYKRATAERPTGTNSEPTFHNVLSRMAKNGFGFAFNSQRTERSKRPLHYKTIISKDTMKRNGFTFLEPFFHNVRLHNETIVERLNRRSELRLNGFRLTSLFA